MSNTLLNINDAVIAEPVAVIAEVYPDDNIVQLLDTDFDDDDEAEFVQSCLELQTTIENLILCDDPERIFYPTEEDLLPPVFKLLEDIDRLKAMPFGCRVLKRMENRIAGVVRPPAMTQEEKAVDPRARKCPRCSFNYIGERGLRDHMVRNICSVIHYAKVLHPSEKTERKVKDSIYHTVLKMAPLIERSQDYKNNIELEIEDYDEPELETFTCDSCNTVQSIENYITIEGDDSGDTICESCYLEGTKQYQCQRCGDKDISCLNENGHCEFCEDDIKKQAAQTECVIKNWTALNWEQSYEPCNPPCEKKGYLGTSWWKRLGYGSPCGCSGFAFNNLTEEEQDKILS
jgi:hypothetical protein